MQKYEIERITSKVVGSFEIWIFANDLANLLMPFYSYF
jgi:hypothetical protein